MPAPPINCHHSNLLPLCLHWRTLNQLKAAHAQATIGGLLTPTTMLDPSPTLSRLLYAFTRLNPLPPPASIDYALSLFHRIPHPSTFPHNILIRAHTLLSSPRLALRVFASMRRLSVPPDLHTFPFALKACSHLGGCPPRLGRALHSQALKFGFDGDEFVCNTLISVYASSGSVAEAHQLFDGGPPHRDVVSYNTLMDGYAKAGEMARARKIFDEMPARDVISYGTLLAGYSRSSRCEEALQLFDLMVASGLRPDDVSLVCALSACARLGALDRGKSIHNYIARHRTRPNVFLSTGLVDMYAKCGCIDAAMETFESCCPNNKNLFTWNAIIVGLGMHGHGRLSLEYFNRMLQAARPIRPDGVTFLGVLIGCSHAGLVDVARRLFDGMVVIYGVERELKHYGCMSDMLGRAGLIEEAMEMIEGMPMEVDEYVWGGVLGGCRIHGNVEVAEIAAAHLLELNPEDSGIYSVLANIYAGARRWGDVSRVRRLMDERKVRKINVGCSSVAVDDEEDNPADMKHVDNQQQLHG